MTEHELKGKGIERIYIWAKNMKAEAEPYTSFRVGADYEEQQETIIACRDEWLMGRLIELIEEEFPEFKEEEK